MNASPIGVLLHRASSLLAIVGGLTFCALAALTVVSVLGRTMLSSPIPGDFELVAFGTGIAAFMCLPYGQLNRDYIKVDLFIGRSWPRLGSVLDAAGGLICAVIAAAFAWRMTLGLVDAIRDRDITVIVGLPLWWAYPFAVASFALLAACCIYTAVCDLRGAGQAG
jgi:TRAP-type C4-dicarboxylate transport system permease small subunit